MKKLLVALMSIVLLSTACLDNLNSVSQSQNITITAAGATFPMPFYNLAIENYSKESGNLVTYGGIGSGGGIKKLQEKAVDFGATDAFLNEKQEAEMPGEVIHIPTCMGAVVIAFNIPEVNSIKLNNETIQEIFTGKITKWNDEKIQVANSEIHLPDLDIMVIHRSDASGTTFIFSDYLCKISSTWETEMGKGKSLNWKTGYGANGNNGVAANIHQLPGSIGYIGSEYALSRNISYAKIENSSGKFISPNLQSISASAQTEIPANTKIMLTNSPNEEAYPICGFTWIILYKEQQYNNRTKEQALTTINFITKLLDKNYQNFAKDAGYSPLPNNVIDQALTNLKQVTYSGEIL